jgi:hypothetical protein
MSMMLNDIDPNSQSTLHPESQTNHRFMNEHCRQIASELRQIFSFHPTKWLVAFRPNSYYPIFVKGDIDGFVGLFINNLAVLLAVVLSLQPILGNAIVYGKIVPG